VILTLTTQQIPIHSHAFVASADPGTTGTPTDAVMAQNIQVSMYSQFPAANALNNLAIGGTGGSQPHENTMPFLVITFIISLFGIFPSQN
jgi:microcystin-dependent protein